jgi:hypothetical protein
MYEDNAKVPISKKHIFIWSKHHHHQVILKTMRDLPKSIRLLSPLVDFVVTFENEEKPGGEPRLLHSIRRNSSNNSLDSSKDTPVADPVPPFLLLFSFFFRFYIKKNIHKYFSYHYSLCIYAFIHLLRCSPPWLNGRHMHHFQDFHQKDS